MRCDVCVVGAGLSGLTCARALLGAQPSLKVIIVEARERAGGRTLNQSFEGGVIDLGGQWVGPDQKLVRALIKQLGLQTYEQTWFADGFSEDENPASSEGEIKTKIEASADSNGQDTRPLISGAATGDMEEWEKAEFANVIAEIHKMALTVPLDAPWTCPSAEEWDKKSVLEFLQQEIKSPSVLRDMIVVVLGMLAAEPRDLSLLYFLLFVRSAGGLHQLADGPGGAQHWKIRGGAQRIALTMAQELQTRTTCQIQFERAVRLIDQTSPTIVRVHADNGPVIEATRVVVAMPPPVISQIEFRPKLPRAREEIVRGMQMGCVVKAFAVYDTAFWKDKAVAGWEKRFSEGGPVVNVFDAEVKPGTKRQPGEMPLLVGFVFGDTARKLLRRGPEAIKQAVLQQYRFVFGTDKAVQPLYFTFKDWSGDMWSKGCFAGVMPPGVIMASKSAIRDPFERVHWAGTETALRWNGYFEGAIESGLRVAAEILPKVEKGKERKEKGGSASYWSTSLGSAAARKALESGAQATLAAGLLLETKLSKL